MERYKKYKDSGIDWIGEIPEHWNVIKLKYIGESIIGITYSPSDIVQGDGTLVLRSSNIQDGKLSFQDCVFIEKEIPEKLKVRKGDILICSRNGSRALIGKNITIDEKTEGQTFGAFMTVFRTKFFDFVSKYFNSQVFNGQSGLFLTSTINQLTINTINNFFIALPPLEEQKTIARYLDRKTAEIDKLIAQKERLIELYEEEKTAIINQAVTKGINPNVKLKPSGIGWLGNIPEHWEVTALKRLVEKVTDGEHISPKFTTEGMPFLSAKDVRDGYVQMPDDKFVDYQDGLKFRKRCNPELNDILLVSRGATIGRVAIINTDIVFCLLGSVILLKPKQNIYSQYLFYSLKNKLLQDDFLNSSQSSAQQAIYLVDVASVYLAFPPIKEQKAIAEYIETECDRIDSKIAKTKRIIKLQKEYRTALISEAVTGKIKVPQFH